MDIDWLLISVPFLLFLLDIIGKQIIGVPIDTVGADLCMYTVSFDLSTVLLDKVVDLSTSSDRHNFAFGQTLSVLLLVLTLIAWLLSLHLISRDPRTRLPNILKKDDHKWGIIASICLGLLTLFFNVVLFAKIIR